jgi:UDP-N-acetylmuramate dehydrogenase
MDFRENAPLAPLTTLGVGGPARWLAEATTEDEVRAALEFAASRNAPLFVLGGGSNVLVADEGFPGVVLRVGLRGVRTSSEGPVEALEAGAGEDWDAFVGVCVAGGLAGLECLSGIPGTVGGTPVQNVGAYGQEVAPAIRSVRVLDRASGAAREMTRYECGFGYRTSVFNTSARDQHIVLRVTFVLPRGAAPNLSYRDVRGYFAARSGAAAGPPTLAEVREAVREIRRGKSMLLVPGDPDCRSAGSFFKNPVLSEVQFNKLMVRASAKGLTVPSYPALDAQRKVSAAWLVEHSGFSKGFTLGAAGISKKHALALVNRGGARAAEIVRLKDEIQRAVLEVWGIALEAEPVMIGF